MSELLLDAAGRRRSPATLPEFHAGRPPRNKGMRYPADPPTIEEIVTVMRHAGDGVHSRRLRGLIVVLWRAGLRICEALALAEADLDARRGSLLVRRGKGGRRREVGIDDWAWEQLAPWLQARVRLPVGPLFCVVTRATRGRPWAAAAARTELRRVARAAGVRRRFARHQLRHAHAVEMAREGVPLIVIQRQLGHGAPITAKQQRTRVSRLAPIARRSTHAATWLSCASRRKEKHVAHRGPPTDSDVLRRCRTLIEFPASVHLPTRTPHARWYQRNTRARLTHDRRIPMTRRISAAAVASIAVLGVASVATADSGRSAKTFKASLAAVPAATTADLATVAGKAQLVDGKKNNKASLHMRNLAANTMYLWHVHEGTCAATGAPVAGWTYRTQVGANGTLTSDESGNANTKGKSTTFNADPSKSYSVNVHVATLTNGLPAGTIIACGDLKSKSKKPHPAQAKGPKS